MPEMQREVYKGVLLKDLEAVQGASKERARLLNIVMQLRKAANHPYLFDGVEDRTLPPLGEHLITNSGKMIVLDKLIKKLLPQGSRILIFSQMARQLDILEDYCVFRQWQYCRIDGSTSSEDREDHISNFNAENSTKQVFLLTTRAGGLGINLATADIVIIYDSDWNPQADLQAQDRAHRIGQKKPVIVYRLVVRNTVEEKVVERAELKLRLDALVIQQGRATSSNASKISKDAMLNMIRFGADQIFHAESTNLDEDIDAIISRGEQITQQLKEQAESQAVKLSSILNSDAADPSEALDMEWAEEGKELDLKFLSNMVNALGKREKRNRPAEPVAAARPVKSLGVLFDFQFFNKARLYELQNKEISGPLSPEEEEERTRLLAEAFGSWSKSDFFKFVGACETYGRNNMDQIARALSHKPLEEVQRYHEVFFSRYKEIEDYERHIARIEKGEKKLAKAKDISSLLFKVLENTSVKDLDFKYTAQLKLKGWSGANDRFLIERTMTRGFGEWDQIRQDIRKHPDFAFDYFFRSRTSAEIGKRVEALIKILPIS
jgi:SWI/SNF-related matrix-associated actin-dependent regulator of chromatin subfamily A member 5